MSWGNKLLITFLVFGSGMIYLVYRCMHTKFELVEKDYYKNELAYQEVIDAAHRTGRLSTAVKLTITTDQFQLQLPVEMNGRLPEGEIWFYCAYDSRKDKRVPLQVNSDGLQQLPPALLSAGHYLAKIRWNVGQEHYYQEIPVTIH
jgi:hypothetical protein